MFPEAHNFRTQSNRDVAFDPAPLPLSLQAWLGDGVHNHFPLALKL